MTTIEALETAFVMEYDLPADAHAVLLRSIADWVEATAPQERAAQLSHLGSICSEAADLLDS